MLMGDGGAERFIWADAIRPYIKSRQIFACTGGPDKVTLAPAPAAGNFPDDNLQGMTYAMNMQGGHWPEGNNAATGYPVSESIIDTPSETEMLHESASAWFGHINNSVAGACFSQLGGDDVVLSGCGRRWCHHTLSTPSGNGEHIVH